jgi:Protease inhibitor Inh
MTFVRTAATILFAWSLAGCAGNPFAGAGAAAADTEMAGRWLLEAPGAPMCGMNFSATLGAREGRVAPEGGCPGNFFMSRYWTLEGSTLTIQDEDRQPLAALNYAGGRFAGQAVTGTPVTLARPVPPPG